MSATNGLKEQIRNIIETLPESVLVEVATFIEYLQYRDSTMNSPDIKQALSELDLFTEEELWRAARMTAPAEKEERMQVLVEKQQLEGLTPAEKQEAAVLSHFFNRVMLVRAKAAVLLKERGQNIDQLHNSPTI